MELPIGIYETYLGKQDDITIQREIDHYEPIILALLREVRKRSSRIIFRLRFRGS